MRSLLMAFSICVPFCLLAIGCGDDSKGEAADVTAATTVLKLKISPLKVLTSPGSPYQASSAEVNLSIEANESARVFYRLDGEEPSTSDRKTGRAFSPVTLVLTHDADLRWFSVDDAGNVEDTQSFAVRFDREPPKVTVEPPAGRFLGPVTVNITSDEAAVVYWTTNGTSPDPDSATTRSAEAPVDVLIERSSTLRFYVEDGATNRSSGQSLRYEIDSAAPSTKASVAAGHYLAGFEVELVADDAEAKIHFTTNGGVPNAGAPIYDRPIRVDESTTIRFSAVDEGGNREVVRAVEYVVGPRPGGAVSTAGDRYDFRAAGGLALGAALIDAAGPISGNDDRPSTGFDWAMWATGRNLVDAYLFQSGVGPHAMHGQSLTAALAAGQGAPDANRNGTPIDDSFDARLEALAGSVGATVPKDIHLASVIYRGSRSRLQRPTAGRLDADGRPSWVNDYGQLRWSGADSPDRAFTVAATASGLDALAARARAATARDHTLADDEYAVQVAPIVGLRCATCHHLGGAAPSLVSVGQLRAADLLDDDAAGSSLIGYLTGETAHPVDPAMPEEIERIRAWIDGPQNVAPGATVPGDTAEEGFLGLLAIEHAALLLGEIRAIGIYDPTERSLGALPVGASGVQYVPSVAAITESASVANLPHRLGTIRVTERNFHTAEQGALLDALVSVYRLESQRRGLFAAGAPLAGDDVVESAPDSAETLIRAQVRAITRQAWSIAEGSYIAVRQPDNDSETFTAMGAARAASALLRTKSLNLTGVQIGNEPMRAIDWLVIKLRDRNGDYQTALADRSGSIRELMTQLVVLDALLLSGAHAEDADALWARLESAWWDAGNSVYVTELGSISDRYDAALMAQLLKTLTRASARYPEATDRLASIYATLVVPMINAETWLTGENGRVPDSDEDGILKPDRVAVGNGVAPTLAPVVQR